MGAHDNPYARYEAGLAELMRRISSGHPHYFDVQTCKQQLQENIQTVLRYGDTKDLSHERSRIIDQLNTHTLHALGLSFLELCNEVST